MASFNVFENFLRVYFSENQNTNYADYHFYWLRHNCSCKPYCKHITTNERIIDSTEIPLKIAPKNVNVDQNILAIEWNLPLTNPEMEPKNGESHKSEYTLEWLKTHAYAMNRQRVEPPPTNVSAIELNYEIIKQDATAENKDSAILLRDQMRIRLQQYGAVVVRNFGLDTEEVINTFLPSGCSVIETHFGRIEDLKKDNTTNKNTDQLGYTDAAVNLHTDQPFIETPPGMQLLHCIEQAETGGENYVVAARQATRYLRSIDKAAYDLLTTVPVVFHRKQKEFESIKICPILEVDPVSGELVKIRYSYFTVDPYNIPFEQMEEWYRAYNKFGDLVRNPQNQYRFMLHSGDFLIYDNYAMLHARTSFTGKRWLRGVYFDHLDVWRKLTDKETKVLHE